MVRWEHGSYLWDWVVSLAITLLPTFLMGSASSLYFFCFLLWAVARAGQGHAGDCLPQEWDITPEILTQNKLD